MLLLFQVSNFRSIKDTITLSLIAKKEKLHGERLYKFDGFRGRVLPIASVHGGNASGKTNLIKALAATKRLVIKRPQMDEHLRFEPFLLEASYTHKPTTFLTQILLKKKIYEYEVHHKEEGIIFERLSLIKWSSSKTQARQILFERGPEKIIAGELCVRTEKDQLVFGVLEASLRPCDTLLNILYQQASGKNSEELTWSPAIKEVFDWFRFSLGIVSNKDGTVIPSPENVEKISELLPFFDVGICGLHYLNVEPEKEFNEGLVSSISEVLDQLPEGQAIPFPTRHKGAFLVRRFEGKLQFSRLFSYHKTSDGKIVNFDLSQESDGTKQLFKILPYFYDIAKSSKSRTLFIDELDIKLHPLLVQKILKDFLDVCPTINSQLIFSTHDSSLLDTELFRRDEMNLMERKADGASTLHTLSSTTEKNKLKNLRYDSNLQKEYLNQNIGGVANLSKENFLMPSNEEEPI